VALLLPQKDLHFLKTFQIKVQKTMFMEKNISEKSQITTKYILKELIF